MSFSTARPMRFLTVLGVCLGLATSAVATAPLVWKVVVAAAPSSDDLVAGAMLTRSGDLLAQLRVTYGKPGAGAPVETAFVRIRNNGAVQWLSRSPVLDASGLLAEAPDGGWYSISPTPDADAANADLLIRRWTTNGRLLWTRQWDGPLHQRDAPHAAASDSDGNLLVAGESSGLPAMWKYDPEGTLLWTASYPNPGAFTHLVVDPEDRGVAAGTLDQVANGYLVAVYAPDGAEAWSDEHQDAPNPRERLTALALGPSGDVCVTGVSAASSKFPAAGKTLRYTSDGALRWSQRYTNPTLFGLQPTGIAVDADNNVYVSITGSANPRRTLCVLVKYLPSSEPEWSVQRKHARGLELPLGNVRVDARGYIHVFQMTTRSPSRFTESTYQVHGDVVRDAGYHLGGDPLLAGLDSQGNALALANPLRGKIRKHDIVALKLRRFLNSKGQ